MHSINEKVINSENRKGKKIVKYSQINKNSQIINANSKVTTTLKSDRQELLAVVKEMGLDKMMFSKEPKICLDLNFDLKEKHENVSPSDTRLLIQKMPKNAKKKRKGSENSQLNVKETSEIYKKRIKITRNEKGIYMPQEKADVNCEKLQKIIQEMCSNEAKVILKRCDDLRQNTFVIPTSKIDQMIADYQIVSKTIDEDSAKQKTHIKVLNNDILHQTVNNSPSSKCKIIESVKKIDSEANEAMLDECDSNMCDVPIISRAKGEETSEIVNKGICELAVHNEVKKDVCKNVMLQMHSDEILDQADREVKTSCKKQLIGKGPNQGVKQKFIKAIKEKSKSAITAELQKCKSSYLCAKKMQKVWKKSLKVVKSEKGVYLPQPRSVGYSVKLQKLIQEMRIREPRIIIKRCDFLLQNKDTIPAAEVTCNKILKNKLSSQDVISEATLGKMHNHVMNNEILHLKMANISDQEETSFEMNDTNEVNQISDSVNKTRNLLSNKKVNSIMVNDRVVNKKVNADQPIIVKKNNIKRLDSLKEFDGLPEIDANQDVVCSENFNDETKNQNKKQVSIEIEIKNNDVKQRTSEFKYKEDNLADLNKNQAQVPYKNDSLEQLIKKSAFVEMHDPITDELDNQSISDPSNHSQILNLNIEAETPLNTKDENEVSYDKKCAVTICDKTLNSVASKSKETLESTIRNQQILQSLDTNLASELRISGNSIHLGIATEISKNQKLKCNQLSSDINTVSLSENCLTNISVSKPLVTKETCNQVVVSDDANLMERFQNIKKNLNVDKNTTNKNVVNLENTSGFATASTSNSETSAAHSKDKSPLPDYDHIEENIIRFERKRSKNKKEIRRLVCDCKLTEKEKIDGAQGCREDCLNRLIMIECGSRCSTGAACSNKRFQKMEYKKSVPFKTDKKGFGLKVLENVVKGDFVIEYVGEVMNRKQLNQRIQEYARENKSHYYFMTLKRDEFIDATKKGNYSRFINHSCDPNCETQKWFVNGESRVGLFAKRNISAGEELTFDYQFECYGREPQECHCEASNCVGHIGGSNTSFTLAEKGSNKTVQRSRKSEIKKYAPSDDFMMDEEIGKIYRSGCINSKEDALNLARAMVNVDDVKVRLKLIDIILKSSINNLSFFLEYHGLSLLWCWMARETDFYFKCKVLEALFLLPIPNKTVLLESNIFQIVEKWSQNDPNKFTCVPIELSSNHSVVNEINNFEDKSIHLKTETISDSDMSKDGLDKNNYEQKDQANPEIIPNDSYTSIRSDEDSSEDNSTSMINEKKIYLELSQKARRLLDSWKLLEETKEENKKTRKNEGDDLEIVKEKPTLKKKASQSELLQPKLIKPSSQNKKSEEFGKRSYAKSSIISRNVLKSKKEHEKQVSKKATIKDLSKKDSSTHCITKVCVMNELEKPVRKHNEDKVGKTFEKPFKEENANASISMKNEKYKQNENCKEAKDCHNRRPLKLCIQEQDTKESLEREKAAVKDFITKDLNKFFRKERMMNEMRKSKKIEYKLTNNRPGKLTKNVEVKKDKSAKVKKCIEKLKKDSSEISKQKKSVRQDFSKQFVSKSFNKEMCSTKLLKTENSVIKNVHKELKKNVTSKDVLSESDVLAKKSLKNNEQERQHAVDKLVAKPTEKTDDHNCQEKFLGKESEVAICQKIDTEKHELRTFEFMKENFERDLENMIQQESQVVEEKFHAYVSEIESEGGVKMFNCEHDVGNFEAECEKEQVKDNQIEINKVIENKLSTKFDNQTKSNEISKDTDKFEKRHSFKTNSTLSYLQLRRHFQQSAISCVTKGQNKLLNVKTQESAHDSKMNMSCANFPKPKKVLLPTPKIYANIFPYGKHTETTLLRLPNPNRQKEYRKYNNSLEKNCHAQSIPYQSVNNLQSQSSFNTQFMYNFVDTQWLESSVEGKQHNIHAKELSNQVLPSSNIDETGGLNCPKTTAIGPPLRYLFPPPSLAIPPPTLSVQPSQVSLLTNSRKMQPNLVSQVAENSHSSAKSLPSSEVFNNPSHPASHSSAADPVTFTNKSAHSVLTQFLPILNSSALAPSVITPTRNFVLPPSLHMNESSQITHSSTPLNGNNSESISSSTILAPHNAPIPAVIPHQISGASTSSATFPSNLPSASSLGNTYSSVQLLPQIGSVPTNLAYSGISSSSSSVATAPYSTFRNNQALHYIPPSDSSSQVNQDSVQKKEKASEQKKKKSTYDLEEKLYLPKNWKAAIDCSGRMYFYHTIKRISQWEPPTEELSSEDEDELKNGESNSVAKSKRRSKTTSAAADTSITEEIAKKIKERFRSKLSSVVVKYLNTYRESSCSVGRITTTKDFKYLARRVTHMIMEKEIKHCRNVIEDLELNSSVKNKTFQFIKKYMAKFGAIYEYKKKNS